jgi:hypothetical protein
MVVSFALTTACDKQDQPSAKTPPGATIGSGQSALEAALIIFLVAADRAHKKSEPSADEQAQPELKKRTAQNAARTRMERPRAPSTHSPEHEKHDS